MKRRSKLPKSADVVALAPVPQLAFTAPRLGRLAGLTSEGLPLVEFEGASGPLAARVACSVEAPVLEGAVARQAEVVLLFENGQPSRPLLVGILQLPQTGLRAVETVPATRPEVAELDGRRIVLSAEDEVVLACGDASITLRRNGRVVIRGTHIESDSSGMQRIKGAAVKVN